MPHCLRRGDSCFGFLGQTPILGTAQQKSGYRINDNRLIFNLNLARPRRFERLTAWFVARYSIQLSYGRFGIFREQTASFTKRRMITKQKKICDFSVAIFAILSGSYCLHLMAVTTATARWCGDTVESSFLVLSAQNLLGREQSVVDAY